MMALRSGMLLVATLLAMAALGAFSGDLQPSALRVMVTAVVGLLALLFWPGLAATPARTALRVAGWSMAAALLAAAVLALAGSGRQPWTRIGTSCAMLWLILLVAHALAAVLETRFRAWRGGTLAHSPVDAPLQARSQAHPQAHLQTHSQATTESAGRMLAWLLALLGSLPLWLGPLAELLSGRHDWAVDAVIGASPLTHLAVASGNDLLRNQWFYQHVNLSGLQFSYPDLAAIVAAYGLACLMLALGAFGLGRRRVAIAGTTLSHPPPRR